MLKVLIYYLNKRNEQYMESLMLMLIIFLLKESSKTLSKGVLEELIDSLLDLVKREEQKKFKG